MAVERSTEPTSIPEQEGREVFPLVLLALPAETKVTQWRDLMFAYP